MKKILFSIAAILFLISNSSIAQVSTNFNNDIIISAKGQFDKSYVTAIDLVIPSKNIDSLLSKEKREIAQSNELKPFKLAEPTKVNLDIPKLTKWTYDKEFAYGKFTLKLSGALSASINFDKFYLPENTELFVYNENGKMITGPVTEKENNKEGIWGSWVYQGELITIEIKTPIVSMKELILHSDNVAYGYKEIYKSIKVGGFGTSGPCNINVICPLGIGWEGERNSVSTILSANGSEFCTGSLVMNTCGTNTPYYLTANHCFNGNSNVGGWRFAFQAWSTTCPNPGTNTNGVIYNGATLRARNAPSDFCLVELNQTPPVNSGLHYAGWNRSTTPAQNATGIHHPSGDLMKISRANNPVTVASNFGTTNQHWRADWSPQNNGAGQIVTAVTEGGSSGSPLFDQNRRIIGQLHGGPSFCGSSQPWDFYGRFDLSWTGGGTNSTRLSNWLDPNNTGALFTNTTNRNQLGQQVQPFSLINQYNNQNCNETNVFASGVPNGVSITWSTTNGALINGNPSPFTTTSNSVLISSNLSTTIAAVVQSGTCTFSSTSSFCPCEPWDNPVINWIYSSPATNEPLQAEVNPAHPDAIRYEWYINGQLVETTYGTFLSTFNWPCTSEGEGLSVIAITSCGTTTPVYGGTYSAICNQFRTSSNVKLYPNPASSQVVIQLEDINSKSADGQNVKITSTLKSIIQINIIDKMGVSRRVFKFSRGNSLSTINISDLPPDLYYLDISDGITHVRKPLVIRR
jgi:hypothetical protein